MKVEPNDESVELNIMTELFTAVSVTIIHDIKQATSLEIGRRLLRAMNIEVLMVLCVGLVHLMEASP